MAVDQQSINTYFIYVNNKVDNSQNTASIAPVGSWRVQEDFEMSPLSILINLVLDTFLTSAFRAISWLGDVVFIADMVVNGVVRIQEKWKISAGCVW